MQHTVLKYCIDEPLEDNTSFHLTGFYRIVDKLQLLCKLCCSSVVLYCVAYS